MPITSRRAATADAPRIMTIGSAEFSRVFGPSSTNDLSLYLQSAFSVSTIEQEILESSKHVYIVACATQNISTASPSILASEVIGFAQLTYGAIASCLSGPSSRVAELRRVYLHHACQGLGIARSLVAELERVAQDDMECKLVWLGVWEHNARAIKFYEKLDYRQLGCKDFVVGKCIQKGHVMAKLLAAHPWSHVDPAR